MNIYLGTGIWPSFLRPKGINTIDQRVSTPVHLASFSRHVCDGTSVCEALSTADLSKAHLQVGIAVQ